MLDEKGMAGILKNNKPFYIVVDYRENTDTVIRWTDRLQSSSLL